MGGSETYVRSLLREYAHGNGPEEVTVLANRHVMRAYAGATEGPVTLRHVASYRAGDRTATRAIAMAFARVAPRRVARDVPGGLDVVHYPVTVAIPRATAPTVVTSHEVLHHVLPASLSRGERLYRRLAYDAAIRSADIVITLSDHLRETIVERLGIPAERVEVAYLGIDADRFRAVGEQSRPSGVPGRFVFFPANLWPHKNHSRLLEALRIVTDPEVSLVLAGQTYGALDRLMETARGLGVASRVVHLGYVPTRDLPALYRAADAVVFPSLYENFGLPPLEAMACGCPVASSTAGALGEVCGDAVLPFDPREPEEIAAAIDTILADNALRAGLRERGARRAHEFDSARTAERHVEIYRRATVIGRRVA